MKWIKRNIPWLITALCTFVSFVLWLVFQNHPNLTSLFINLTAGFFISTFSICIIDRILENQKKQEIKPLKKALFRDVIQFKRELVDVWSEMYQQSIVERTSITIEELFSKDIIYSVFQHLDLEGKPCLFPYTNWYEYLNCSCDNMKIIGNKILDFYANIAPPELLDTIHYLVNNSVFTCGFIKLAIARREYEIENNIPSRSMLTTYTTLPRDKDYLEVRKLLAWCKEYGKKLYGDPKIEYTERVIIINPDEPPTSVLTEERKQMIATEREARQEKRSGAE